MRASSRTMLQLEGLRGPGCSRRVFRDTDCHNMELLRTCATTLFMLLLIARTNSELHILEEIAQSQLTGVSTFFYEWGTSKDPNLKVDALWDTVWIRAAGRRLRDPASYAALSCQKSAIPYWGQRVQFRAKLGRQGLRPRGPAFAVMFVRVVSADGRTLAFDNMKDRHAVGETYYQSRESIVLDVPGLPSSDACPAGGSLPMFIQVGFLLSGGVGYVDLSEAFFDVVSSAIAVTGGPPPWLPPGIDMP